MADGRSYDAVVAGAGPAGLMAALALGAVGARVAIAGRPFAPDPARPDTRTTAFLGGSVAMLHNLGVWHRLAHTPAPLETLQMVDATGRLFRAPDVTFEARELRLPALGYNIVNADLVAALHQAIAEAPQVTFVPTEAVRGVHITPSVATLELADGAELTGRLLVAADGRDSMARAAAGLEVRRWAYDQAAIACNLTHRTPHKGVCIEFHRPHGPFTLVPLSDPHQSSLVWVDSRETVGRLMALDEAAFIQAAYAQGHGGVLGITAVGPRASFPLEGLTATRFAGNRTVLVGEAGHVAPPIGAQGLNLGFRDAAVLADCVADGLRAGQDVGGAPVLARYHSARRTDVWTRTAAIDLLNRSLALGLLPLQIARGVGLSLVSRLPVLRRTMMRQGLGPDGVEPRLMQHRVAELA